MPAQTTVDLNQKITRSYSPNDPTQPDGPWHLNVTGTSSGPGPHPATPAQSSPNMTTANAVILAANAARLGGTIYNEGPSACLLLLGTPATTASYSCSVASGGYYEIPFGYVGEIDGITASSTAQLRVTELTA